MAEPIRVDLKAPLGGRHILVDTDRIDFGVLEDLDSGKIKLILDALASILVGGDLPGGVDRAGLRKLRPVEMRAVSEGVGESVQVPKS